VSEAEFDASLGRVRLAGVPHGRSPEPGNDGGINHCNGGRGGNFLDANGHYYELLTRA
jgi:hypothetical protein